MYGAFGFTYAAAHTLVIIDDSEVVDYRDGSLRTISCTKTASYTACRAFLTHRRTLLMVGAYDYDASDVGEQLYKVIRAGLCAETAAEAFSGIYVRYTVFYADGVLRTDGFTITEADASEGAFAAAAVKHLCSGTRLDALIDMLLLLINAIAAAMYESDLFDNVLALYPEHVGDLLGYCVGAGNAEVGLCTGVFSQRVSIAVASCKTACAAVCSGQTFTYLDLRLVDGYAHEM